MEIRSRAGITSLRGLLAIRPKSLCSQVFRVLHILLGWPLRKLKTFPENGHVNSPPMGTMPELPGDILMDIFSTLEIPDLMRAGSVCSSWRSAYSELRNLTKYKLSQTPCLFYTSESAAENVAFLYSLVEKRAYKLALPDPPIRSRFLVGSSHGWLVTVDDRSEMHLLNPITCEQVALPSVITMEHVKPIFSKFGAVDKYELSWHTGEKVISTPQIFALRDLRDSFHYKAFVFKDTQDGSYIVVLIHGPRSQLSFTRVGDDKWTWLPPHAEYDDCTYKDGILYAITEMREIHAFDLSGSVVTVQVILEMDRYVGDNMHIDNMYIVQAPSGDLLNVWRGCPYAEGYDPLTELMEVRVYKVDTVAKGLMGSKCMHDHVLFLGHNQSLCLSAAQHPSLKANHVYFTDDDHYLEFRKNNPRDIGVFDQENHKREELVSPKLWSNWPVPVWVTPSLTKMTLELNKVL